MFKTSSFTKKCLCLIAVLGFCAVSNSFSNVFSETISRDRKERGSWTKLSLESLKTGVLVPSFLSIAGKGDRKSVLKSALISSGMPFVRSLLEKNLDSFLEDLLDVFLTTVKKDT